MTYQFLDQSRNTRAEINPSPELGFNLTIFRLHDEHLVADHSEDSLEKALDHAANEYKIPLKAWIKHSQSSGMSPSKSYPL